MDRAIADSTVSAVALAVYALAALFYLAGYRRARNRQGDDVPQPRDAVLVQGGLLIGLLALVSPLAHWAQVYIWVRAMQDILLAFVAPALIAAGRPWLAWRGLRPAAQPQAVPSSGALNGNDMAHLADDLPQPEPGWTRAALPLLAVIAFNLAWLGWHVPAAFDLVERNPAVRGLEQASYLGAGIWFWIEIACPRPSGYWHAPLRRLAMVTATVAAGTVLGMALVFGAHVDYPAYSNSAHHIMTVLDDQQLSGAVLWMGVLPSLVVAGVALLNSWLNEEEAGPPDPGVLQHRTSGWSARPRLR
jgi:putative membrane protein